MLAAQYRRTSTGAGDRVCRAPSIVFGGGTGRLINSSEVGLVPLIVFPRLEFLLEGRSPVLEEFLLPAVEDCWLEPRIIAELRDGFLLQQMPSHDGDGLFRRVVLPLPLHGPSPLPFGRTPSPFPTEPEHIGWLVPRKKGRIPTEECGISRSWVSAWKVPANRTYS